MQEKLSRSRTSLVRKQLLLTSAQNDRLKARAAETGRPESELMREALDAWLVRQSEQEDDWKAAWLQAAGMWNDRADLDAIFGDRRVRRSARRRQMVLSSPKKR